MAAVKLVSLTKEYQNGENYIRAVDDVSFSIKEGEFIAVIGASGSGKSTIAKLIASLWDVDSGSIKIGGGDVKEMAPFLDYVVTAQVSEKTLVDAFKKAVDMTFETSAHKPGLIAVSGLNYTVDPEEGELLAMNFIDKEGKEHKIDVENPSEDKMYKVVTDEFLMSAGADYDILAPEEVYVEKFPYDKDVLTCEYIKEMNEPVVINQVGRIKFVHEED